MSEALRLDTDSVTAWVVETNEGVLVGPFESADEAAEWIMWVDDEGVADFHAKIRPVTVPDPDAVAEDDECEECEDEICTCEDDEAE